MAEEKTSWWSSIMKAKNIGGIIALLMIVLAGFSAFYFWKHPKVVTVVQNHYEQMPPVTTHNVIIHERIIYDTQIVIIEKPGIPSLPDYVVSDSHLQVTAIGNVPSYEGNTSVTAIIKLPEGKTSLYLKREPLPFFEFKNKGWLDLGLGFRNLSGNYDVKITWEYSRIGKAITWASIEQNSRPETIGMVGVRIPLWN